VVIKLDNVFHTNSSTIFCTVVHCGKVSYVATYILFFPRLFKFKFITIPFRSTYVCHSEPRNDYKEKLRENTVPNEKISALWIGIENNIHFFYYYFVSERVSGLINYTKMVACSDVTLSDLCARTFPRHLCYEGSWEFSV
jgi:hypothetical protein